MTKLIEDAKNIDTTKAIQDCVHWKTLVPPGGTNSSVGGTNSNTNGIKRKYPPHLSLIPTSLIISTTFINHR